MHVPPLPCSDRHLVHFYTNGLDSVTVLNAIQTADSMQSLSARLEP
jgi:hypothetical protein